MREILDEAHIHPAVRDKVSANNRDLVNEVKTAVAAHDVVVVGMKQNPHCRKARVYLKDVGVPFEYLEYGSYWLGQWRRRNAIKMWTGWPTMPMVFVKGTLVGGAEDLKRLIDSGELDTMIA